MANRKRAITLSLLAMVALMTVMAEMVIWPQSVREGRGEERVRSKASRHSQGGMLQGAANKSPVQPGLVDIADTETQAIGHPIVVETEGRAEVDRETVDVFALQAAVVERRLQRLCGKAQLAVRQAASEF